MSADLPRIDFTYEEAEVLMKEFGYSTHAGCRDLVMAAFWEGANRATAALKQERDAAVECLRQLDDVARKFYGRPDTAEFMAERHPALVVRHASAAVLQERKRAETAEAEVVELKVSVSNMDRLLKLNADNRAVLEAEIAALRAALSEARDARALANIRHGKCSDRCQELRAALRELEDKRAAMLQAISARSDFDDENGTDEEAEELLVRCSNASSDLDEAFRAARALIKEG